MNSEQVKAKGTQDVSVALGGSLAALRLHQHVETLQMGSACACPWLALVQQSLAQQNVAA